MLVSVVIPVYNASRYLRKCLDSCLSQTYKSVEIVCVNDGSTDDSLEILKSYGDCIKLITQPNGGVVSARNAGLEAVGGEFVYFLDSDDWLPSTAIADLVQIIDDETDIVFGNLRIVRADGEKDRVVLPGFEWTGCQYVNESLRYVNGCIGGKMVRTEICRRLTIDGTMRLNEDLLMNIQAGTMARKVKRVDKINYFYNWAHEGSLSKSQTKESLDSVLKAHQMILGILVKDKRLADALSDGYVSYLQKNILMICGSPLYLPNCEFMSKEARRALSRSPARYATLAISQGFWGWVLFAALMRLRLARGAYLLALKLRKAF